jgi:TDG/mug DNA glycosylase family protein
VSSTRGIEFGRQREHPAGKVGGQSGSRTSGKRERHAGFPEVFVLPSPSGAARSHWDIAPWRELARWLEAN